MGNNKVERIKELERLLRVASDRYYNAEPIMEDHEFDRLCDELAALDPGNEFLKEIGAHIATSVWPKVKHKYIMGSQDKVKTKDEFYKWADGKGPFVITDKLDGSSIAITYQDGHIISAVTRGDGVEGEDITVNVMRMKNVRPIDGFSGVIRCEMIIGLSDFNNYFKPLGYKNPRNAANGIARDKSHSHLVDYINVIPFDVMGVPFRTELEKAEFIRKHGLEYVFIKGPFDAEQVWHEFEQRALDRPALSFEVDGVVVKVNDIAAQASYGVSNGRPRGQVAIKYSSQSKETTINDIHWQVGMNGIISPVAILDPIDIGGVTISRCTLNNRDYISKLGISVGARVVVTRNNDVIPGISKVVSHGTSNTNEPKHCPSCGRAVQYKGAYIICTTTNCYSKVVGNLNAWIRATKINGIGPSILHKLIDLGITDVAKFVSMSIDVLELATGSRKIAQKIYEQIKRCNVDLQTLLYGLNVPHVGEINGRKLAAHFGSIDKIRNASIDDIAAVPGIKTMAEEIWAALKERSTILDELSKTIHINANASSDNISNGPLSGKSFCITGELSKPRAIIHELITSYGGKVKNDVSRDLDYLVMANMNSTSSKAEKARKYGVRCIDENCLMDMINRKNT
ncbi:MAG: NAD-dependent DNA ligase LigA [Nitrososphaerales archaeon]